MASALINNASQIYFDSVFGMEDEGMVKMFKALESAGLRGFLGCSSAIYEAALMEFFQNASVRDGKFISTVQEGLTEMADVPKDLVFDARTAFYFDGQQLKTSCKKREMKYEFRLLNEIFTKTVIVKVGSFDAVTHERFLMISAIHGEFKVNWGRLLFNIFKDMVTPATKQARGFAVKICILFKGAPDLELRDSKDFPPLKILSAKTVGTFVAKNKNISVEYVDDEPVVAKVVKKAASKRRPAPVVGELVLKKNRTPVERAAPTDKNLALLLWLKMLNQSQLSQLRLLKTDGVWKVVEDAHRWIRMYRKAIEKKQPSMANFDPICFFFEPVQVVRSLPLVKTWGWARVCTDTVQFHLFGHLDPIGTTNLCTDLVAVGPVVDHSGTPHMTVNIVRYSIQIVDSISITSSDTFAIETVVDIEADLAVALGIPQRSPDADLVSPHSYSDSPMHFTTADIPLGDEPTAFLPPDLTTDCTAPCYSGSDFP
ncbi:hypothetical protein F511_02673 [Dorcoceras hygrometricum]|uniref:Dystroglycan-like n=1 Tax=Dorcoceras hygrometricum TaxID=472368 RepID=A0A2Z7D7U8_9LAMI|nr:hypothetical protein F511_02673 [Dorcoceras hygrometricum]